MSSVCLIRILAASRCDTIPGIELGCNYAGAEIDINAIKVDVIYNLGRRVRGNHIMFQFGTDFA